MPLPPVAIIVNAIFLLMALVLSIRLLRAGSRYQYNIGNIEIQDKMKWIIMRTVVILSFLGMVAALFNLVIFLLPAV